MSSKISKIYIATKLSKIEEQAQEQKEVLNGMTREQLIQTGKRDKETSLGRISVIWGQRYELFQLRKIAKKEGYVYDDGDWEKC